MAEAAGGERPGQRRRTRKALLDAATRLMREGRRPTLEDIAEEASVSRATAYRYFQSADALLLEASLDVAIPVPGDLFPENDTEADLIARLGRVDTALHDVIVAHEAALRTMLSQSVLRAVTGEAAGTPARQDRRTPLIRAAIEGARGELEPEFAALLANALSFFEGPEAMIVARDVLEIDDDEARRVRRWAIEALVAAATRSIPSQA